MDKLTAQMHLTDEAKAWLQFKRGFREVVSIIPDLHCTDAAQCYDIYTAYDSPNVFLGRILFDQQGYWIYDGDLLHVDEREQIARFIINSK